MAGKKHAGARHVLGHRIRRRRLFLNMTQAALARALGITFQQVQKYETGANKVPEERLRQIALHLDVTPDYFTSDAVGHADALEHFVQSREGLALYRAMACVADSDTRASLILAVEAFADSHVRPEENGAEVLTNWLRTITGNQKDAAAAIQAAKIEVAQLIGQTLKARKLTQKFAASILHTDQARVSALARGNVKATSLEKLLRYLVLLGWDASLTIAKRPMGRRGTIAISSADD